MSLSGLMKSAAKKNFFIILQKEHDMHDYRFSPVIYPQNKAVLRIPKIHSDTTTIAEYLQYSS